MNDTELGVSNANRHTGKSACTLAAQLAADLRTVEQHGWTAYRRAYIDRLTALVVEAVATS